MRILGLTQQQSGCGFHRIILPIGFMNNVKGYVTNHPVEEIMSEKWDILFYNRLSNFDNNLDEVRKQLSCKIVFDLDDDWVLPPNHILYDTYESFKPRIENNIRVADLVTCTNERLADRIYPFNNNVKIIPNAIPFGYHQFLPDKIEDEKVRIFWCGSCTHERDLALLRNPFKRLTTFKDKIKMVIGGYNEGDAYTKKIWDTMSSHLSSGGNLPLEKLGSLLPDAYMEMYEYADICVIPLEDSDWHGCKSNLKILEAATKKIPVIVSAVEPYIKDYDAPVLWVKQKSDWFNHIKYLLLNSEARKDYGEKLFDWANKKYNLLEINKTRETAFKDLTNS